MIDVHVHPDLDAPEAVTLTASAAMVDRLWNDPKKAPAYAFILLVCDAEAPTEDSILTASSLPPPVIRAVMNQWLELQAERSQDDPFFQCPKPV